MRLIWSALWGAFPREIHLISEFLIPSLRGRALAPFAAPREVEGVEGGRQAQARGEGQGGEAPRGPQPSPHVAQPPSQTARGPGVWALGQGPAFSGEAATPLPFLTWTESAGPGNGKPEKEQKGGEESWCKWGQRTGSR